MPTKEDFEKALDDWFRECEKEGNSYVDVRAGDLHRRVGEYPGSGQRMPTCCDVMYENRQSLDNILHKPPKGKGASLEIRYALPRKQVNRGQNVKTVLPPPKSFTIKCQYSEGSGLDPHPGNITGKYCPICKGTGRITLTGSQEDYETDEICKGTGKDPYDVLDPWKPHDICKGTGLVKKAL